MGDSNRKAIKVVSAPIVINKGIPVEDMFIFTPPSELYDDGREKRATIDTKSVYEDAEISGMGEVTLYYYDANNEKMLSAPKAVGIYTVKIMVAEGVNYEASTAELADSTWTFTIESVSVLDVELNENTITLSVEEISQLEASVTPENATNKEVEWSSSNEAVAVVDANGKVTVVSAGVATITATAKDGSGASGSCTVMVTEPIVENPLFDVPENAWYYPFALRAYNEGIVSGVGTDEETGLIKFAPEVTIPREQFVQILYSRAGKPAVEYSPIFSDVAEQSATVWYSDAIMWASQNDLVSGYDNGKFGVGDLITREQVAVILKKYAEYRGYDTSFNKELDDWKVTFNDVDEIHSWASDGMCWAVEYGIMSGKSGGWLMPLGNATRAEAATMILGMMDSYEE